MIENPLIWHAMVVLAMPVAAKNMHEALRVVPRVQASLPRCLQTFCSTFRENSIRMRNQFFRHELIQLMWTKYIEEENTYISRYLESLINVQEKQSEAATLLREIFVLSNRLDF